MTESEAVQLAKSIALRYLRNGQWADYDSMTDFIAHVKANDVPNDIPVTDTVFANGVATIILSIKGEF